MKLTPCPFCGSADLIDVEFESSSIMDRRYFDKLPALVKVIYCNTCEAHGPEALTKLGAIRKWNKRKPTT